MSLVLLPIPDSPTNPGGPIRRGTGALIPINYNTKVLETPSAGVFEPEPGINWDMRNRLYNDLAFLPDGRLVPRSTFPPTTNFNGTFGDFGAEDDPWLILWGDIEGMINTVAALNTTTNDDIQKNKTKFTGRELVNWHEFVAEWLKWKNSWLEAGTASKLLSATSGNWAIAKDYKRRSLEWALFVEDRLGVSRIPGRPRAPLVDKPWYQSPYVWVTTGIVGLVAAGYFVRSFGVASVARAKAARSQQRRLGPVKKNGHRKK